MKEYLYKCFNYVDRALDGGPWTRFRVVSWAFEQIKRRFPRAYKKPMQERKEDDEREDEDDAAEEIRIATGRSMSPP